MPGTSGPTVGLEDSAHPTKIAIVTKESRFLADLRSKQKTLPPMFHGRRAVVAIDVND
jgi:hypothetical protein